MTRVPSSKRQALILIGIHILAGFLFLSPSYIRPDSVAVHSWLRSLAVNGDLLFYDEWAGFGMIGQGFAYFKEVTPVGALANHWWVGASILNAPFFLASHALSMLLPGEAFPTNGFFGLDLAMLGWTAVLFHALTLAVALLAVRHVSGEPPNGRLTAAALAFTSLGTPAFWYAFRMPLGTHAAGMLVVGILTYLCLTRDEAGQVSDDGSAGTITNGLAPFLIGMTLGLAIATRLQHAVLLPAVLYAFARARRPVRDYLLAAAGGMAPLLIQGAAWHAVYGTPFGPLASGANLEGVTWMVFRKIAIAPVLLSSWRGLFVWSPIWIPALAGLVLLARDRTSRVRRDAGVICLLMFAGELFANATLDRYWWGGMSFGPRRFVDLAVPVAIGLWALLARTRLTGMIVAALATVWSCLLMFAATAGTIDLSRYLDWAALGSGVGAAWTSFTAGALRSPITSGTLAMQSALALVVIGSLVAIIGRIVRGRPPVAVRLVVGWLVGCLVVVLLAIGPTRQRAAAEQTRLGLTGPAAASAGPLIDQRGLIADELDWLEATGRERDAARTRDEIGRIDAELSRLGVGP